MVIPNNNKKVKTSFCREGTLDRYLCTMVSPSFRDFPPLIMMCIARALDLKKYTAASQLIHRTFFRRRVIRVHLTHSTINKLRYNFCMFLNEFCGTLCLVDIHNIVRYFLYYVNSIRCVVDHQFMVIAECERPLKQIIPQTNATSFAVHQSRHLIDVSLNP
mmetsp:Transcript_10210/g.16708  ORF Transcript_10210/g.16708 Transcript_10210/m.16708 type:complete len:161 (+) Transcript_10210:53-535(+)